MATKHDTTAELIAAKLGVQYNKGQGADIKARDRVVEVETAATVSDGPRQLRGHRKPAYIAGADPKATRKALEAVQGTTIGVMDQTGKIIKRSTRKKR